MATTRIMPLHVGKGRTESRAISDIIDYVANPQKTDNGNGIVCSSMHPLHISLCGAHGDQSITDRLSLQRLRRKQQ